MGGGVHIVLVAPDVERLGVNEVVDGSDCLRK
jgi:hypothetical protein